MLSTDPTRFEAPLDFSYLKEIHKGPERTFIIHIQDPHSNLSGQQNVANTLDVLMKRYGVYTVLVEGGSPADGSLTPLKSIAPAELIKRVAKSLLMEGKISGEEYLNLITDHPMKIRGVEDMSLYMKSVENYAGLSDKREEVLGYLTSIDSALCKIKRKVYPAELLHFEDCKVEGDPESTETSEYDLLLKLSRERSIDLGEFPNARRLSDLKEKEKGIDFDLANLEQAALIQQLEAKGASEEVKGELQKWSHTKNSKATQYALFQNLFNLASQKGIEEKDFPNLTAYGRYLRAFSELEMDLLLDELVALEDRLYIVTLKDRDAKLVRAIDRYVTLLRTAYNIQMSSNEFRAFKANEPDMATVNYLAFVNRKLTELGFLEDLVPYRPLLEQGARALDEFYRSVDQRDVAFVENIRSILREEQQQVVVLIAGGYHSQHLKKLFKKQGFSYAVLTPVVTSETNKRKYEEALLGPLRGTAKKLEVSSGSSKRDERTLATLDKTIAKGKKHEGVRAMAAFVLPAAEGLAQDVVRRRDEGVGIDEATKQDYGKQIEVFSRKLDQLRENVLRLATANNAGPIAQWTGRIDTVQARLRDASEALKALPVTAAPQAVQEAVAPTAGTDEAGARLAVGFPRDFEPNSIPGRDIGGTIEVKGKEYYKNEAGYLDVYREGFMMADLPFKIVPDRERAGELTSEEIAVTTPEYILQVHGQKGWIPLRLATIQEDYTLMVVRGVKPEGLVLDRTEVNALTGEAEYRVYRYRDGMFEEGSEEARREFRDMELGDLPEGQKDHRILVTFTENGINPVTVLLPREVYTDRVSRAYRKDLPAQTGDRDTPRPMAIQREDGEYLDAASQQRYSLYPDHSQPAAMGITLLNTFTETPRFEIDNYGSKNKVRFYNFIDRSIAAGRPEFTHDSIEVHSQLGLPSVLREPGSVIDYEDEFNEGRFVRLRRGQNQEFKFPIGVPFEITVTIQKQQVPEARVVMKIDERVGLEGEKILSLYVQEADGTWKEQGKNFLGFEVPPAGQHAIQDREFMSVVPSYALRLDNRGNVTVTNFSTDQVDIKMLGSEDGSGVGARLADGPVLSDRQRELVSRYLPGYSISGESKNGQVSLSITVPDLRDRPAFTVATTLSEDDPLYRPFIERLAYDIGYFGSNEGGYGMTPEGSARRSLREFGEILRTRAAGALSAEERLALEQRVTDLEGRIAQAAAQAEVSTDMVTSLTLRGRVLDLSAQLDSARTRLASSGARLAADDLDDGRPIVDGSLGLEKWNISKAVQRVLSLADGSYTLTDLVSRINEELKDERNQKFTPETLENILSVVAQNMVGVKVRLEGEGAARTVVISRQAVPVIESVEAAKQQFAGRKIIAIGGPSNLTDDHRGGIPLIRQLLEEVKAKDPRAVIAIGTTGFGYGRQIQKIAKELGLETVSFIPSEHLEWAAEADHHVVAGRNWNEASYYNDLAELVDALFTVEGYGGTKREFQAAQAAGKKTFRLRVDLEESTANLASQVGLIFDPASTATAVQTAAEWGAIGPDEARRIIRVRYAALAQANANGKLTAIQKHQLRQELLATYGLLNTDGSLNYKSFYENYVTKASNASREAWLKDYEVVTSFIDEVEYRITDQEVRDFAFAIHDNGYWRDRKAEIEAKTVARGEHLLLGRVPSFEKGSAAETEFLGFLTDEGRAAYEQRFAKSGGYKILLSHIRTDRWIDFYAKYGTQKDVESLRAFLFKEGQVNPAINPAKLQVFNANADSWTALLDDIANFDDLSASEREALLGLKTRQEKEAYLESIGKTARLQVMRGNQTSGMASAFALVKIPEALSFFQMDYATAVIWRYKGHWSGEKGWEEVYQVRTDYYSADFDADRLKDGPIWRAVLDRQLELSGITNPAERFLRVVLLRSTNESKYAFISSYDSIVQRVAEVRAEVRAEMQSDPERIARLSLVSHDLGYWPTVSADMSNPAKPALGRAPSLEGADLETFLSFLTDAGRQIYADRFKSASGYKILVQHIQAEKRAEFYTFMQRITGLDKSAVIAAPGSLKEKDQVFNANYGTWADLLKDLPAFDAQAGPGKRLEVMMKNQEANIIMTRILSRTDSFLTGMQMSHAMAVLWRYVVGDYQEEYAYDGKDRNGQADPQGWRNGSPQVRTNYYDPAFANERAKDYEMWSSLLVAMSVAERAGRAQAVREQLLDRSSNESELAWKSTYGAIVRYAKEVEGTISRADLEKYAPKVHDNGYWAGEKRKIGNPDSPFLGSHVDVEGRIEEFLSPQALEWWQNRHDQAYIDRASEAPAGFKRLGPKGYQITAEVFKDADALRRFYLSIGKSEAAIAALVSKPGTVILNENAMSFENALREAARYGASAAKRTDTIYGNQKSAIATGLVFADLDLTQEEMAYLTAVLWRYTGHWSGEEGYSKEWQVSEDYLMGLDRAEREKDVTILAAVYEVLGKTPKASGEFVVDNSVKASELDARGIPRDADQAPLDLSLGDRVYLKIDGKWYAGSVTDYRGDGMLDGRFDPSGNVGNQYWQVAGFMVKLDFRVPGVLTPPNGIFLTDKMLKAEKEKTDITKRSVLKIVPAALTGPESMVDGIIVSKGARLAEVAALETVAPATGAPPVQVLDRELSQEQLDTVIDHLRSESYFRSLPRKGDPNYQAVSDYIASIIRSEGALVLYQKDVDIYAQRTAHFHLILEGEVQLTTNPDLKRYHEENRQRGIVDPSMPTRFDGPTFGRGQGVGTFSVAANFEEEEHWGEMRSTQAVVSLTLNSKQYVELLKLTMPEVERPEARIDAGQVTALAGQRDRGTHLIRDYGETPKAGVPYATQGEIYYVRRERDVVRRINKLKDNGTITAEEATARIREYDAIKGYDLVVKGKDGNFYGVKHPIQYGAKNASANQFLLQSDFLAAPRDIQSGAKTQSRTLLNSNGDELSNTEFLALARNLSVEPDPSRAADPNDVYLVKAPGADPMNAPTRGSPGKVTLQLRGPNGDTVYPEAVEIPSHGVVDPAELRARLGFSSLYDVTILSIDAPGAVVYRLNVTEYRADLEGSYRYSIYEMIAQLANKNYTMDMDTIETLTRIFEETEAKLRKVLFADRTDLSMDIRIELIKLVQEYVTVDKGLMLRLSAEPLRVDEIGMIFARYVASILRDRTLTLAAEDAFLNDYLSRPTDGLAVNVQNVVNVHQLQSQAVSRLSPEDRKKLSWRDIKHAFTYGADAYLAGREVTGYTAIPLIESDHGRMQFPAQIGRFSDVVVVPDRHENIFGNQQELLALGIVDADLNLNVDALKGKTVVNMGDIFNRNVDTYGRDLQNLWIRLAYQAREFNSRNKPEDHIRVELILGNHELDLLRWSDAEMTLYFPNLGRRMLADEVRATLRRLVAEGILKIGYYFGDETSANDPESHLNLFHAGLLPQVRARLLTEIAEVNRLAGVERFSSDDKGVIDYANELLRQAVVEGKGFSHFVFGKSKLRGNKAADAPEFSGPVEADFGYWKADFSEAVRQLGLVDPDGKLTDFSEDKLQPEVADLLKTLGILDAAGQLAIARDQVLPTLFRYSLAGHTFTGDRRVFRSAYFGSRDINTVSLLDGGDHQDNPQKERLYDPMATFAIKNGVPYALFPTSRARSEVPKSEPDLYRWLEVRQGKASDATIEAALKRRAERAPVSFTPFSASERPAAAAAAFGQTYRRINGALNREANNASFAPRNIGVLIDNAPIETVTGPVRAESDSVVALEGKFKVTYTDGKTIEVDADANPGVLLSAPDLPAAVEALGTARVLRLDAGRARQLAEDDSFDLFLKELPRPIVGARLALKANTAAEASFVRALDLIGAQRQAGIALTAEAIDQLTLKLDAVIEERDRLDREKNPSGPYLYAAKAKELISFRGDPAVAGADLRLELARLMTIYDITDPNGRRKEILYHEEHHFNELLDFARTVRAANESKMKDPGRIYPLTLIAIYFHDLGYFHSDKGVYAPDHEERSKSKTDDFAYALGLSPDEVSAVKYLIDKTKFKLAIPGKRAPTDFGFEVLADNNAYRDIEANASAPAKFSQQTADFLNTHFAGRFGSDLDLVRDTILAGKVIAIADVYAQDPSNLYLVSRLQPEFVHDDNDPSLRETLLARPTRFEQVADSAGFKAFSLIARLNFLLYGVDASGNALAPEAADAPLSINVDAAKAGREEGIAAMKQIGAWIADLVNRPRGSTEAVAAERGLRAYIEKGLQSGILSNEDAAVLSNEIELFKVRLNAKREMVRKAINEQFNIQIDDELLDKLVRAGESYEFSDGKTIFREGSAVGANPFVYLIANGTVRVTAPGVDVARTKGFIGEMAIVGKSFDPKSQNLPETVVSYLLNEARVIRKQVIAGKEYLIWDSGMNANVLRNKMSLIDSGIVDRVLKAFEESPQPPRSATAVVSGGATLIRIPANVFLEAIKGSAFTEMVTAAVRSNMDSQSKAMVTGSYIARAYSYGATDTGARLAEDAPALTSRDIAAPVAESVIAGPAAENAVGSPVTTTAPEAVDDALRFLRANGVELPTDALLVSQLSQVADGERDLLSMLAASLISTKGREDLPTQVKISEDTRVTRALRANRTDDGGAVLVLSVADRQGGEVREFEYPFDRAEMEGARRRLQDAGKTVVTAQQLAEKSISIEIDTAVAEFARPGREGERAERDLLAARDARGDPVVDTQAHVVNFVLSGQLSGGVEALDRLVAGELSTLKARPSSLGPESHVLLDPQNASRTLLDAFDKPESLPTGPNVRYNVVVSDQADFSQVRDQLAAQLTALLPGEANAALREAILGRFNIVVAPEVISTDRGRYQVGNLSALLSVARITARTDLDRMASVSGLDRVVSFFKTMMPGIRESVRSNSDLRDELANLKDYKYKEGVKYQRYTIAIVKIAIDQILSFTQKALVAIGSAA